MAKFGGVQMGRSLGRVKPPEPESGATRCTRMKNFQLAGVLAALALAACSGPEQEPPPAPAPAAARQPAPEPAVVVPTIDLSGEWRVAQIWGADPDPGTTVIQVSITEDRIRAQSQCKHWWWTYTVAGGAFKAAREPYPDPICERTESYWERYFAEAIDRASSIVPYPDGSVLITGPGGQVLLRSKT